MQIGDFLRAALAGKHAVVEQQCLRIGIGCAGLFQAAVLLEHADHIGGRFGIQRVFVRLGIIAQLIEPFAQRQHVGVSVADIQRMILRQLLFGVGEGNFIFDLRDGIAADDGEQRAHFALGDGNQLHGLDLAHQLGEHVALFIVFSLFDVQPEFAVLFHFADGGQRGVGGDFAQAASVGLFAQIGALERADETRLVINGLVLNGVLRRGRRGRFAVRIRRGGRFRGRRRGRRGRRFGRRRGHGFEQFIENIALASAFCAHIGPVFAVDFTDGNDGQHAGLFQRFELVALFVGQSPSVTGICPTGLTWRTSSASM